MQNTSYTRFRASPQFETFVHDLQHQWADARDANALGASLNKKYVASIGSDRKSKKPSDSHPQFGHDGLQQQGSGTHRAQGRGGEVKAAAPPQHPHQGSLLDLRHNRQLSEPGAPAAGSGSNNDNNGSQHPHQPQMEPSTQPPRRLRPAHSSSDLRHNS